MSEDKGYAEVVEHGARLGRRSVLLAMQIRRQVIRDIGPPDPVAHPYSQGLYDGMVTELDGWIARLQREEGL